MAHANLRALATNFVYAGFTPVIDWVIPDFDQIELYRRALAPCPVRLVVLAPSIAIYRYRNAGRHPEQQFFFDDFEQLMASMQDEMDSLGWHFDTSLLTPEETASEVVMQATSRALRGTV